MSHFKSTSNNWYDIDIGISDRTENDISKYDYFVFVF